MTHKAFKFRLKPTKTQDEHLRRCGGATRWLWNYMLDLNKKTHQETGKFVFRFDMQNQLPDMKKEYEWLKEVPSQSLQVKCQHLDLALKRVWKSSFGFPKFKSKHQACDSFHIPQSINGQIKPMKKQIKIPKIGWVKWNRHRPLEGVLVSITVKQELGKWYAVCLCELLEVEPKQVIDSLVGIDLGLKEFAVTSDGEVFDTPKLYRRKQKKLARQQRILARRKKGSKNREKARAKLAKTHQKIRNQRQDFTHKVSNSITKNYTFVAIEDLNIKGMAKNRRLAKAISDQGWAMFLGQLDYKSKNNGGKAVRVDRWAPSSKTCSNCGTKHQMPLAVRVMRCDCGHDMDRDLNAAINIRRWGFKLLVGMGHTEPAEMRNACGDTSVGVGSFDSARYVSLKQEKLLSFGEEAATLQGSQ